MENPTSEEVKQIQQTLDEAFAEFRQENPSAAEALRALNISYVEYLRLLYNLQPELHSITGNIFS